MVNAQNCTIANAVLWKVPSILCHQILNFAVCRYRNLICNCMIRCKCWRKTEFMRFFSKFCSFRNEICKYLILNPKKQTEQRFYESVGAQRSILELKVLNKRREHLHIHRLSFYLWFLKLLTKALLTIQLWLLDLTPVHFYRPDNANARVRYFLVHAVLSKSDCWIDSILLY